MPDVTRKVIAGTSHWPHLDKPQEFNRLLDEFLALPHQREDVVIERFGSRKFALADFRHLPTRAKFLALMPQWHFLNFLAERGGTYPEFQLRMQAEAVDLLQENGAVTGVRAKAPSVNAMRIRSRSSLFFIWSRIMV